jgi:hypothetical protein
LEKQERNQAQMASTWLFCRASAKFMQGGASLPIYIVFFVAIAFTIYFPEVVLWLPKHLLPQSVGCFPNPNGPRFICH